MLNKWRESSTFKLIIISLLILNYQWLFGGIVATLTEYATATATLLAVWLGREWKTTHYKKEKDKDA